MVGSGLVWLGLHSFSGFLSLCFVWSKYRYGLVLLAVGFVDLVYCFFVVWLLVGRVF